MDAKILMQAFIEATVHVCKTMAQLCPKSCEPYYKKDNKALGHTTAFITVENTAGHKGSIAISFPQKTALVVVDVMFGDDVDDGLVAAKEMVGELANIISGDARRRLAEKNFVYSGSTPTFIEGDSHEINHVGSAPVIVLPFELPEGRFVVEVSFES